MPVKIFVGRIADGTKKDDLQSLFEKYGKVVECDVLSNFGFVHMGQLDEANAAIKALDGYNLKGSSIHVELSTARTQGRKKKLDGRGPPLRGRSNHYEPYPRPPLAHHPPDTMRPSQHDSNNQHKEEYASEQVKDLLELYFRDPVAFDQYAKTYYYGERMERMARIGKPVPTGYLHPSRRY